MVNQEKKDFLKLRREVSLQQKLDEEENIKERFIENSCKQEHIAKMEMNNCTEKEEKMKIKDENENKTKNKDNEDDKGAILKSWVHFIEHECPDCSAPCVTTFHMVDLDHFKDTLLMSCTCDKCGYKDSEVKDGGPFQDKGRRTTLKLTNASDLSREVVKTYTCSVKIPELDFELLAGSPSQITNIEGLLFKIINDLKDLIVVGDDELAVKNTQIVIEELCGRLEKIATGEVLNIDLILDDPAGNSYIQNPYTPNKDPKMTVEEYERTQEQNDELGISAMMAGNCQDLESAPEADSTSLQEHCVKAQPAPEAVHCPGEFSHLLEAGREIPRCARGG